MDGVTFADFGRQLPEMDPGQYGAHSRRIRVEGSRKARYLQLELSPFNGGIIPDWHPGRGNPTWVFADEFGFVAVPLP